MAKNGKITSVTAGTSRRHKGMETVTVSIGRKYKDRDSVTTVRHMYERDTTSLQRSRRLARGLEMTLAFHLSQRLLACGFNKIEVPYD